MQDIDDQHRNGVSKNLHVGIKYVTSIKHCYLVGMSRENFVYPSFFLAQIENLIAKKPKIQPTRLKQRSLSGNFYTRVISWVHDILNHIDNTRTSPKHNNYCMLYIPSK